MLFRAALARGWLAEALRDRGALRLRALALRRKIWDCVALSKAPFVLRRAKRMLFSKLSAVLVCHRTLSPSA